MKVYFDVLNKELGSLEAACFLRLFETGEGDYTREREKLHSDETIDSIASRILKKRNENP